MGSSNSRLPSQDLEDYQDLTYLSRNEIVRAFKRMQKEVQEAGRNPKQPSDMFLRLQELYRMPELMYNPFADRICSVFSSRNDDCLNFEDFLDMQSVFSEAAPKSVKTAYAFKIYDFNNDGLLDSQDLAELIRRLTTPELHGGLQQREVDQIVKFVMQEADLDENGYISLTEFELVVAKSPDFTKTFCIRF